MEDKALKVRRLQEMDVQGKRVLVRVDYNVPLKGEKVLDNTRIRETLPTLKRLIEAEAKIVLIAHLGRPKGKPEGKHSLKPVAAELEKLSKYKVNFAADCIGEAADSVVSKLSGGEIALLENLRFHPEEEKNDAGFAKQLAKHGELFIQEAFGAIHRAHASTTGVAKFLPGCIGLLVQKELEFLDRVINNPQRPFLAILGGAKVSDKIGVTLRLLDRVDGMLIGGAMCYTFLQAQGVSIGKSLLEAERVEDAKRIIEKAYSKEVELLLPADHLAVKEIKEDASTQLSQGMAVPEGWIGVDIGPRSIEIFQEKIAAAKTIFWNGPMGIFEMKPFSKGSFAVAKAMAEATAKGAVTIVGGGDSLAVLGQAGLSGKMSHCSTGGGASLEFLEGKLLPGLAALSKEQP
ncbi:MAG: phosphoglycerate kinase [Elusimicrobia bacterium]|nr:phosphoglycerate kinase [Elusimicrobiota bacterium]